ncbi:MAG: hypothetical protein ABJK43_04955, partial [Lentilitoribacter sp.]
EKIDRLSEKKLYWYTVKKIISCRDDLYVNFLFFNNTHGNCYDVVIVGRFNIAEDRTGTMAALWDLTKADD